MARIGIVPEIPLDKWSTGFYRVMPLPGLGDEFYAAKFDEIGLVPSDVVRSAQRLVCLTPFGINLLQQRFIWYLTRFVAPTYRLNEACAAVFEEADLCEEWVRVAAERGVAADEAAAAFHDWIRAADSSDLTRQRQLEEPQRRAVVRRDMRRHLAGDK
jgi:hypothetical protein